MKGYKFGKKFAASVLSASMLVTMLSPTNAVAGLVKAEGEETEEDAQEGEAEAPASNATISMPITLMDHINDGLLFEYELYNNDINPLKMFDDANGTNYGKVNKLGVLGTPLYDQETVDYVADIVANYLETYTKEDLEKKLKKDNVPMNDTFLQLYNSIMSQAPGDSVNLFDYDPIIGDELKAAKIDEIKDRGWNWEDTLTASYDQDK